MDMVFSSIAVAISLVALVFNLRSFRDRRVQDRRDLFLKMHERLLELEVQEGRRLLFKHIHTQADAARIREQEEEVHQQITRALAMFDLLAMYIERNYIDREVAMEEWGPGIARAYERSLPYIEDRREAQGFNGLIHFRSLGREVCGELPASRGRADPNSK